MQTSKYTASRLTRAAVIAALYAAITLLFAPIAFGPMQLRVSEAMTILPILFPAAIEGLFAGCLIANLLGSATIYDIVFGSLATLLAALATRALRRRPVLAALPPVVLNAVIVGLVLSMTIENLPFGLTAIQIGAGEAIACYVLGLPLLWALGRVPRIRDMCEK